MVDWCRRCGAPQCSARGRAGMLEMPARSRRAGGAQGCDCGLAGGNCFLGAQGSSSASECLVTSRPLDSLQCVAAQYGTGRCMTKKRTPTPIPSKLHSVGARRPTFTIAGGRLHSPTVRHSVDTQHAKEHPHRCFSDVPRCPQQKLQQKTAQINSFESLEKIWGPEKKYFLVTSHPRAPGDTFLSLSYTYAQQRQNTVFSSSCTNFFRTPPPGMVKNAPAPAHGSGARSAAPNSLARTCNVPSHVGRYTLYEAAY
jgi:hypothetical protein